MKDIVDSVEVKKEVIEDYDEDDYREDLEDGRIRCNLCEKIMKNELMFKKYVEYYDVRKDIECRVEGCYKKFKRFWDMEYYMVIIYGYVKIVVGNIVRSEDVLSGIKLKKVKRKKKKGVFDFDDEEEYNLIKVLKGIECFRCGMKFKILVIFKRYYEIYIGEKSFICEVCLKNFFRKYDMYIY